MISLIKPIAVLATFSALVILACGGDGTQVEKSRTESPVVRAANRAVLEHDLSQMQLAVWAYQKKTGRYPQVLEEIAWRYLGTLPEHPAGGRYTYDPETGVVSSSWGLTGPMVVDSSSLFGQMRVNDSLKFASRRVRDSLHAARGDTVYADTALDIETVDEPEPPESLRGAR